MSGWKRSSPWPSSGAYFESTNEASALTITDGTVTGQSYDGFGGMLAVDTRGQITLRSLADQPYTPDAQITQALQSFPRLVWDGQALPLPQDNGQRARRTVVATDTNGQVLLIVTDTPQWTLSEWGRWLQQSDLQILPALNLDGGPFDRVGGQHTGCE